MTEYTEDQIKALKLEAKTEILEKISDVVKPASSNIPQAVRKPAVFKYGEDFNSYLELWNNYARILNMQEADRGRLLFTFLDQECIDKLTALNLTSEQKNNWSTVKKELKSALEVDSPQQARAKLFSMKQQIGETVEEFGRKIQKLANKAYSTESRDIVARDANIRDIFVYGILDNSIAIHLMNKAEGDFTTVYKDACNLEKNLDARKQVSGATDIQILTTQTKNAPESSKPRVGSDKKCFQCSRTGHWAAQCPTRERRRCYFCGKEGHLRASCFKLRNDTNAYSRQGGTNSRGNYRMGMTNVDRGRNNRQSNASGNERAPCT